jgi:hypothetical protein
MKRIHQFKAGDLIRDRFGAIFRIVEDAKPSMAHHLWQPANGKKIPLHGPVSVAEASAQWVGGEPTPHFFEGSPWFFQADIKTSILYEVIK